MPNSLWPHGLQPARLLCPWRFSWQEYWSRLPCPPAGDLPNLGIKPRSPTLWILYQLKNQEFHINSSVQFSSVTQSCPTLSDPLNCNTPSPTPRVNSNSRPSSQWCHPAISSSVVPFSSCPQSLLASESFPMSQLFAWGGQSIGVRYL